MPPSDEEGGKIEDFDGGRERLSTRKAPVFLSLSLASLDSSLVRGSHKRRR